jgi:hypothetical protein
MGKTGLELIIADLLITSLTSRAGTASADEGNRHPVTDFPVFHAFAHLSDQPGKLMSGHMGQSNIRIVPHPPVPIASAKTRCLDFQYYAMLGSLGIRDLDDLRLFLEGFDEEGFHLVVI